MKFLFSDVKASDLTNVTELNEAEVPKVGPADLQQMQWFADNAAYFRVVKYKGHLAAFLIGLRPGTTYKSPNYLWFCNHYDDFAYIDRVAVALDYRRHGLASRLYEEFAASVPASTGVMTCEVNTIPPNEGSMRFHMNVGFEQVATLANEDESKIVALLVRKIQGPTTLSDRPDR